MEADITKAEPKLLSCSLTIESVVREDSMSALRRGPIAQFFVQYCKETVRCCVCSVDQWNGFRTSLFPLVRSEVVDVLMDNFDYRGNEQGHASPLHVMARKLLSQKIGG
jgi:hypothetical protein